MNDSVSVSSGYSSSTNSNSNSLNRSVNASCVNNNNNSNNTTNSASFLSSSIINTSSISSSSTSSAHSSSFRQSNGSRIAAIDDYLSLPFTPVKRRSKSQTVFYGDEVSTIAEYNKQLIEDLYLLKKKLKEKDETIVKLNDIRNKLESEIQELSASLFEEAYSMVNTARAETAQSEKLLKEANGKIEVLEAEVKALKELVLTSTPSTPNKHLHPHLISHVAGDKSTSHSRKSSLNQQSINNLIQSMQTNSNNGSNSSLNNNINNNNNANNGNIVLGTQISVSASTPNRQDSLTINYATNSHHPIFLHNRSLTHSSTSLQPIAGILNKTHKRVPSHNDMPQKQNFIDKLFSSSSKNRLENSNNNMNGSFTQFTVEIHEFDPIYFKELVEWKENPILKQQGAFMNRIYDEDILPCLNFNDKKVSDELIRSIELNCVCVEELTNAQQYAEAMIQVCGLSKLSSICQYKIKLSESSPWIYISKLTRNRVISVCDFFSYLRYIKDGLVKSEIYEIYWTIIDLRRKISLSRLGL